MLVIPKGKKKKSALVIHVLGVHAVMVEEKEGGRASGRQKDRKSCAILFCHCETMQLASCPHSHDLSIELTRRARTVFSRRLFVLLSSGPQR